MNMDHSYARMKLTTLLRDLDRYSGEEFWREMSRIAAGSTGASHAEGLLAERDALESKLRNEDVSHSNTIDQRDHAESMADRLAQAIMGITGRDIGEHSSAHNPWLAAEEHAEEYEAERDEHEQARTSLEELAGQLQVERDALAAYVERLKEAFHELVGSSDDAKELAGYVLVQECDFDCVIRELEQAPSTSLDRLKAQWQAEGAAMVAESAWSRKHLKPFGITPQECAANLATLISNDLRRQAEEPAE